MINEVVRMHRMIHHIRQHHDTPRQRSAHWLLLAVKRRGPIRLADLAVACYIDASTASRQTAELVAQGLLRRESDPADGRVSLLALTDEGEVAAAELIQQRTKFFTDALADWTADDVRTLRELMGRLTDAIDRQVEQRVPEREQTTDLGKVPT